MNIKNRYNTVLRGQGASRGGGGASVGGGGCRGSGGDADAEGECSDDDNDSESGADAGGADEPVYCVCRNNDSGRGLMIGCDGSSCEIEWFHFSCVGLAARPAGDWYCPSCAAAQTALVEAPVNANKNTEASGSAHKGAGVAHSRARARAVPGSMPSAVATVADVAPVCERFLFLRDIWWRVSAGGLVKMSEAHGPNK